MAVENTTIIIAIGIALIYFILYKKNQLMGSLAMLGFGVLTLYYSSLGVDNTSYGVLGWVILATGFMLLIGYLLSPVKKKRRY